MSNGILIQVVGTLAALCSMTSFAPQLIKIWREKDASNVSLRMYLVTVTSFALWIAYGVLIRAWPVIGANSVCLVMSGAILALRLRYGDGDGDGDGDGEQGSANHAS